MNRLNSSWGDLLTAFNGNTITYDEIGNPLQYYNGNVFAWKQGRRLDTITNNGTLIGSYDYDENGIRTSKTTQWSEYKYILNGSQIVAEMWDDCINIYLYDENGSPVGFLHRYELMADNTYLAYFYEKNMFGDIVAIYDTNGVKQVSYTYDAFGNSTRTIHETATHASKNHLRYRGYYYDFETGLYYLNSRYYDPVTGRFINADGYISTGQGLIGYNMFAYCGNNPVMRFDPSGEWAFAIPFLLKVVEVAVVSLVTLTILSSDEVQDTLSDIADDVSSIFESKTKDKGKNVGDKLEEIAGQYDVGECVEAANAMKKYNNRGNIIKLEFENAYQGYVCCDRYPNTAISETGVHYGYLYNGIVRCNVYPEGLPKEEWISSFYSAGGGPTHIKIY